jgi:hypothetical protein
LKPTELADKKFSFLRKLTTETAKFPLFNSFKLEVPLSLKVIGFSHWQTKA